MSVIKIEDIAHVKFSAPDLGKMRTFLTEFGLDAWRAEDGPLHTKHPAVGAWFDRLHAKPDFREEVPEGGLPGAITSLLHLTQKIRGTTLEKVVGNGVAE